MGTLFQSSYTIPIPEGAKIVGKNVTWLSRGKTKNGTLSGPDRVLVLSEVWTAQYTDESGVVKKVSTKCKDKTAANRVLVKLENEVAQIRAGALSRRDIDASHARKESIVGFIEKYKTKMKSKGCVTEHVRGTIKHIEDIVEACAIESLVDLVETKSMDSRRNRTDRDEEKEKKDTENDQFVPCLD